MKIKIITTLLSTFFFGILHVFPQVGIGTSNPDNSAALDISSTTQGMLPPRMTTAQRLAIVSPAEGLVLYDTDNNAHYFYNGSSWTTLEKRDNYKLIKNISDLADELTNGSGSKYLLTTNYLYEINGSITFDYPIELNGAYLRGDDNLEDRLINASGGPLFIGSTGGNLKRLSVYANGNQVFNISGSGTENLVSFSVNYVGASSIGSLNNLNLVFFNLGQFIANSTGISASNITSYFMTLFNWVASNTGTFLTLSGTFDEVQLSNSRINVNTGEIGIDVSANPTITGAASITQVSFDGLKTAFVNGYTTGSYSGYKFTNEWFVQCQGVLQETDEVATGSVYISTPLVTPIATLNTPIKISGTTTSNGLFRTSSTTNNRIQYIGSKLRYFSYSASLSVTGEGNNKIFNFYIAKNGVVVPESKQSRKITTGTDIGSISISGLIQLDTNDYVEVWVANATDATDITVQSMNFVIK